MAGILIRKTGGGLSREDDYGSKKKPYPLVKSSDFAGKGRSYPIPTKADAIDALRLAGLHGRSDVRAKVYKSYPSLKPKGEKAKCGSKIRLNGGIVKAQSGTKTEQVNKNYSGIYSEDEYENLKNLYKDPNKFVKFKQKVVEDGNEVVIGCLGGCRRNSKALYPEYEDYTKQLWKAGAFSNPKGMWTKDDLLKEFGKVDMNNPANTSGADSWEIAHALEEYGLGKKLFEYRPGNQERTTELSNFDYKNIPVGTILGFGDARGVYVDRNAKSFRGKDEILPRHSAVVQGYVEGVDKNGSPVVDILIDDLGQLLRIGNSTKAERTWSDYSKYKDLVSAVSRNDMEHLTYKNIILNNPKYKGRRDAFMQTISPFLSGSKTIVENVLNI